jgi:NAD-dependent SIR2 family protein deacetylase
MKAVHAHFQNAKRILIFTGAGVSRNPPANIPTYAELPNEEERITRSHLEMADSLYTIFKTKCALAEPTITHHFCAKLHAEGRLMRVYTQNVDDLFLRVLPAEKVVQFHGTIHDDNIVFDGEYPLDREATCAAIRSDFDNADEDKRCDMCIVLGTALDKLPFRLLPNMVHKRAVRVFVNINVAPLEVELRLAASMGTGGYYSIPSPPLKIVGRSVTTSATWTVGWKDTKWRKQYVLEMDCDAFCKQLEEVLI